VADERVASRRKLAAILMIDVSGFSRLMTRDEEGTTREIQAFHERVDARVAEFQGRVVDTAGDSVFGEFDSVVLATRCAQAVQEDQALRNLNLDPARRIETRIGVHVGDVIVEEYKIYGDGVNIAARLESLAEPGGILVSEAVFQQVRDKVPGKFLDGGQRTLKNIDHPVRVYRLEPAALVLASPAPAATPPLPVATLAPIRPPTRREERLEARRRRRPAHDPERAPQSFGESLARTSIASPLVVGVFLLVSPLFLPSAGMFPTAGAVLLGLTLGRAVGRARRRRGYLQIGLGAGIAVGALFTQWSTATNFLFVLGGAIVAVQGFAITKRAPTREP
jgi:class 3 adenylate cyclase